jgi:hypothetical protein
MMRQTSDVSLPYANHCHDLAGGKCGKGYRLGHYMYVSVRSAERALVASRTLFRG